MHLQGQLHLNWAKDNYFSKFNKKNPKKSVQALDLLVEDLHTSKERSINAIICNPNLDDIISGLCQLLLSNSLRVCGNSAYALGTLAENEVGAIRVINLITKCSHFNVIETLLKLLDASDQEAVMNAAGTLGALAEFQDGRNWILDQNFFVNLIEKITNLLPSTDMWIAGNAALVIARIAMSDEGLQALCKLKVVDTLTSNLVSCLGVDEAGRGMNAAFALGRFSDSSVGMEVISKSSARKQLIVSLNEMLRGSDPGCAKNSCFCLSSLASSKLGHSLVIHCPLIDDLLKYMSKLLMSDDSETAWFAAMTFRTLACQPKGCLKLRSVPEIIPSLQECVKNVNSPADLKEEALETIAMLQTIEKPPVPIATVLGPSEVQIEMQPYPTKNKFGVKYRIYQDSSILKHESAETTVVIKNLPPYSLYAFSYCVFNEVDTSPQSDSVYVKTEESVPSAPTNLRILVVTHSQVKIVWEPPSQANGILKNYTVFLGNKVVCTCLETELLSYQHSKGKRCYDSTQELSTIISGLSPDTDYTIYVCASTIKGAGDKATLHIRTLDMGPHLPGKPVAIARGRSEIVLTWEPPENPLGRLTRYQVIMNTSKIVYTGLETSCSIKGLADDTDYKFFIRAITNEGRFDSKSVKKRTGKDEYYDAQRLPLYSLTRRESSSSEHAVSNNPTLRKTKSVVPKSRVSYEDTAAVSGTIARTPDSVRKDINRSPKSSGNKDGDVIQLPMKRFEMMSVVPPPTQKSAKQLSLSNNGKAISFVNDFVPGAECMEQSVLMDKTCNGLTSVGSPTLIVDCKDELEEYSNDAEPNLKQDIETNEKSQLPGHSKKMLTRKSQQSGDVTRLNESASKRLTNRHLQQRETSAHQDDTSMSTLTLEDLTQASLGNTSGRSGLATLPNSEYSNRHNQTHEETTAFLSDTLEHDRVPRVEPLSGKLHQPLPILVSPSSRGFHKKSGEHQTHRNSITNESRIGRQRGASLPDNSQSFNLYFQELGRDLLFQPDNRSNGQRKKNWQASGPFREFTRSRFRPAHTATRGESAAGPAEFSKLRHSVENSPISDAPVLHSKNLFDDFTGQTTHTKPLLQYKANSRHLIRHQRLSPHYQDQGNQRRQTNEIGK